MTRIVFTPVLIAAILGLLSCKPDAPIRVITDSEPIQNLAAGDSVLISLQQCTGCADEWKVIFADTLLTVTDHGYHNECEDCVGGYGDALFKVHAIGRGEAKVGFEYFEDTVVFRFSVR